MNVQQPHVTNENLISLVELLQRRATERPDQIAYTFLHSGNTPPPTLTYHQLEQQTCHIAAYLQANGASHERALLLYPTGLEYIAAFFGCLYAAVVAVPTYPPDPHRIKQTMPRFQAIVQDAQPVVVLTTSAILAQARQLFPFYPELEALNWIATDGLAYESVGEWQNPGCTSDTLAFLQYTSGSTASPKGVMVSHGNLLHNLGYLQHTFSLTPQSVSLTWLPHIHDMGLIDGLLTPLYVGCPAFFMSPFKFIQQPLRWLQAITEHRVTHSGAPNFAYELCVHKVKQEQLAELDLSCWASAYNGAEPVRHTTLQRFGEFFAAANFHPTHFYPCYGLAEATLIVSCRPKEQPPLSCQFDEEALGQGKVVPAQPSTNKVQTLVSSGRSVADDTHIVIVNPHSCGRCAPDEIGEIWVSGPSVTQGYWQRPTETTAVFNAYIHDTHDGPFMRTGDLGFFYQDELFIAGRIKDLLIFNGRNYYPQDIEETVEKSHPALRPGCCAAFAIDQNGAEKLIIAVEVSPSYQPQPPHPNGLPVVSSIKRAVVEMHEILPEDVVLLAARSIPKTSSGKIQRHACRTGYLADRLDKWMAS